MDTKHSQVMQVGQIGGDTIFYFEDYAYTYLKKQQQESECKYFLYGEREQSDEGEKIYIYGISPKPKMEQTYFKEYYPIGFLRTKEEEKFWVNVNGKEKRMEGFYVFYASNQAMQDYLIDSNTEEKQDEQPKREKKRAGAAVQSPIREVLIPKSSLARGRKSKNSSGQGLFAFGCAIILFLVIGVFFTENGEKKVEVFKQIVGEVITKEPTELSNFIIEEKNMTDMIMIEDDSDSLEESGASGESETGENPDKEAVEEGEGMKEGSDHGQAEGIKHVQEASEYGMEEEDGQAEEIKHVQEASEYTAGEEAGSVQEASEYTAVDEGKDSQDIFSDRSVEAENTEETQQTSEEYREYIVKEGDTLAGICNRYYGSTLNMAEICSYNNIENEDYIAPGQKLYLPN